MTELDTFVIYSDGLLDSIPEGKCQTGHIVKPRCVSCKNYVPREEYHVGRELDVLVAEKVMGWKQQSHRLWFDCLGHERWIDYPRQSCWSPSTDIAAAWQVVEKMATNGWRLTLEAKLLHRKEIRAYTVEFEKLVGDDLERVGVSKIKTAPLAICLAALKAVEVQE